MSPLSRSLDLSRRSASTDHDFSPSFSFPQPTNSIHRLLWIQPSRIRNHQSSTPIPLGNPPFQTSLLHLSSNSLPRNLPPIQRLHLLSLHAHSLSFRLQLPRSLQLLCQRQRSLGSLPWSPSLRRSSQGSRRRWKAARRTDGQVREGEGHSQEQLGEGSEAGAGESSWIGEVSESGEGFGGEAEHGGEVWREVSRETRFPRTLFGSPPHPDFRFTLPRFSQSSTVQRAREHHLCSSGGQASSRDLSQRSDRSVRLAQ